MAEEQEQQGTPFNMAMLYYISLRRLIDEKNKAKIQNNIHGWYHGLLAISDEIDFKMSKDDKTWMVSKFQKVENYLGARMPEQSLANQLHRMTMNEVPPILRDIDRKLMQIMNKNNMIFPKIDNTNGLEKLRKGYGLDGKG